MGVAGLIRFFCRRRFPRGIHSRTGKRSFAFDKLLRETNLTEKATKKASGLAMLALSRTTTGVRGSAFSVHTPTTETHRLARVTCQRRRRHRRRLGRPRVRDTYAYPQRARAGAPRIASTVAGASRAPRMPTRSPARRPIAICWTPRWRARASCSGTCFLPRGSRYTPRQRRAGSGRDVASRWSGNLRSLETPALDRPEETFGTRSSSAAG